MPSPKEALRRVRRQAVVGLIGGTIALAASLVSAVQGLGTRQLAFLSAIAGAIVLGFSAYMMSTRFARKFVREVETVSNLPPHDLAHLSAVRARTASIIFVSAFVVLVPVAVVLWQFGFLQPWLIGALGSTLLFSALFFSIYRRVSAGLAGVR